MLESKRISLRLINKGDLRAILEWRQTKAAFDSFFTHPVLNMDMQEAWYESQLKDPSQLNFTIIHKETQLPIGMIALTDIDHQSKKCEWGRIIVGNKEYLGSKYGEEAIEVILDYAFNYLGMNRVACTALVKNDRVVKLYRKIGFVEEGRLREYTYKGGSYMDILVFSMLMSEYRERQ